MYTCCSYKLIQFWQMRGIKEVVIKRTKCETKTHFNITVFLIITEHLSDVLPFISNEESFNFQQIDEAFQLSMSFICQLWVVVKLLTLLICCWFASEHHHSPINTYVHYQTSVTLYQTSSFMSTPTCSRMCHKTLAFSNKHLNNGIHYDVFYI